MRVGKLSCVLAACLRGLVLWLELLLKRINREHPVNAGVPLFALILLTKIGAVLICQTLLKVHGQEQATGREIIQTFNALHALPQLPLHAICSAPGQEGPMCCRLSHHLILTTCFRGWAWPTLCVCLSEDRSGRSSQVIPQPFLPPYFLKLSCLQQ